MENKITTIEKMPLSEVTTISKVFALSGMFTDATSESRAMVKILAGQEIGIPPFAAMSGIHIIQGKPTIGAGLIASRVKGSGKYDYKVKEQSEKQCSIDFYQGKDMIGNSTFTLEDAKKAGTKNIDKFPKNMLFARAISNGVKWFCPDVFSGPVYVPEEMESITDVKHIEVAKDVTDAPAVDAVVMTPQPEITNHTHAINALKKCTTFDELSTAWNRINLETQSHPSVIDELTAWMVAVINASVNETTLKSVWTSIGKIGKAKEFQLHTGIIEAKDKAKESYKQTVS